MLHRSAPRSTPTRRSSSPRARSGCCRRWSRGPLG